VERWVIRTKLDYVNVDEPFYLLNKAEYKEIDSFLCLPNFFPINPPKI